MRPDNPDNIALMIFILYEINCQFVAIGPFTACFSSGTISMDFVGWRVLGPSRSLYVLWYLTQGIEFSWQSNIPKAGNKEDIDNAGFSWC